VMRDLLANTAAELYDFDLPALKKYANAHGPTVGEISTELTELPPNPNDALLGAVRS
jgi:hypothetical protein